MLSLGDILMSNVVSSWLTYFYLLDNALVPAGLFSAIMFLTGLAGVLVALPVGYWSDRTRSRWGRRLPFLFFTGVPRLILFVLLWMPPSKTASMKNVLYLTLISLSHEIVAGIFQIPNKALLPEIARADQERVRISAWVEGFVLVGVVLSGLAGMLIEHLGYVNTALLYAGASFLCFYPPLFVVHEPATAYTTSSEPVSFRQNLSLILRNHSFLLITAIHVLITIDLTLLLVMFPFIVTQVLGLTTGDTVYFYLSGLVASLVGYPLVTWLSARFGKRPVFSGALLSTTLILPGLLFLGDWLPGSLLLILGFAWVMLQALTLSGASVLQTAFIAEVIDHDADETGQRREGAYFAALDFVDRIVYGIAGALPSLFLLIGQGTSGAGRASGIRLVGVFGGILILIAVLLFRHYPLWEKQPALANLSMD